MRKLKLIWDFKGPDGLNIAEHHEIHLRDYVKVKNLKLNITGVEILTSHHAIAYLVVNDDEMKLVRDALKPHRGQVYTK